MPATINDMDEVVTITRANGETGRYVLEVEEPHGRLVLKPDLSVEAIVARTGGRLMTAGEFEEHIGQFILPFDGEQ
jgi:hypothetical protein